MQLTVKLEMCDQQFCGCCECVFHRSLFAMYKDYSRGLMTFEEYAERHLNLAAEFYQEVASAKA